MLCYNKERNIRRLPHGIRTKSKKMVFEEEDEDDDIYEEVEIDTEEEPAKTTSMFEKAKSTKTSDAVRALSANKDSHLVLFEPRVKHKK